MSSSTQPTPAQPSFLRVPYKLEQPAEDPGSDISFTVRTEGLRTPYVQDVKQLFAAIGQSEAGINENTKKLVDAASAGRPVRFHLQKNKVNESSLSALVQVLGGFGLSNQEIAAIREKCIRDSFKYLFGRAEADIQRLGRTVSDALLRGDSKQLNNLRGLVEALKANIKENNYVALANECSQEEREQYCKFALGLQGLGRVLQRDSARLEPATRRQTAGISP